jgi:hypothetical protein
MGIPNEQVTDAMRRLATGVELGPPRRRLTRGRELERQEQYLLVAWLKEQEDAGRLTYDWSSTHKKVTRRIGMPDFAVYKGGQALLGEMKLPGAKLSDEQQRIHKAFLRSGTSVEIWTSAEVAKRSIMNWVWVNFREELPYQ